VSPALAETASCHDNRVFSDWLDGVKREAVIQGISRRTIAAAFDGVDFDSRVIARDRNQSVFQQSFLQFSDRTVTDDRLRRGARLLKRHQALLGRIERRYGVPPQVLLALWALESDFDASVGKFNTIRALATLAYDCRRHAEFRLQLMDALRIIERGDLRPSEMKGDWAGELGPMQFPASDYYEFGVDFDDDGKRDLINSIPDMLASTANLLAGWGWRRGEPWLEAVHVPAGMAWDQADLAIRHPRAQWRQWGVVPAADGSLFVDDLPASLLLPMGYRGPAFLAYHNFRAFLRWNQAMVYATTSAYLATRLAGASPVARGNVVVPLSPGQIPELQTLLVKHGYLVGPVDAKVGRATRAAVKAAQIAFGMPADSYPTPELLDRLRAVP
jgi:lytic murein transglycosylase